MQRTYYNIKLFLVIALNVHRNNLNDEKTGSEIAIWILFFFCTLLLMIVILNLLIAFINDSYVHVVEKK